jgi:aryl-alcohol dehydrogenase-like predicted oxidoreductase
VSYRRGYKLRSQGNGYFGGDVTGGNFDNPANRARRETVRAQATAQGATPTQIALAWLLSQPGDVRPIVGTSRIGHLEEAMGAGRELRVEG